MAFSQKAWAIFLFFVFCIPYISFLPGFSWMGYAFSPLFILNYILAIIGLAMKKGLGISTFILISCALYLVNRNFGRVHTYKVALFVFASLLCGNLYQNGSMGKLIKGTRPAIAYYGEKYIQEIEAYKTKHGTYPTSLNDIEEPTMYRICAPSPVYQRKGKGFTFSLQRGLPVPEMHIYTTYCSGVGMCNGMEIEGYPKWRWAVTGD